MFTAKSESSGYWLLVGQAYQCIFGLSEQSGRNCRADAGYLNIRLHYMLEHTGVRHFDSYFALIAWLLAPNRVVLVHLIRGHHDTKHCNRWLNTYIFPGGYITSLEQMTRAAGRQGLKIMDM